MWRLAYGGNVDKSERKKRHLYCVVDKDCNTVDFLI